MAGAARTARTLLLMLLGAVGLWAAACGSDREHSQLAGPDGGSSVSTPAGACSDVFSDDQITTYEIQISQADWDGLVTDFHNMAQNAALGLDVHPYHPLIEFRYGGEVVPNAMIRLKGQSSWREAVESGDNPAKMQFVISFTEVDPTTRFHGLRKVELDMPRTDPSYLRQRLTLTYLRALGLPAQCANSGRLIVNGAYYGLFTNLERPDKEFIQRLFPGQDSGDLWDGGWGLETNEETLSDPHPRLDAWWAVKDVASFTAISDVDEALAEWAGEAMIDDSDGFWIGRHNFFIYDHPTRGWIWIPHDLDATIDWVSELIDPLYYWGRYTAWDGPWAHYTAVIGDDTLREKYVAALRRAHDVFVAAQLLEKLDQYAKQIEEAATSDPTRPFGVADHISAVDSLRAALRARGDYIRSWLDCRSAGTGTDADGDGHPFCFECNDSDPGAYPGAPEICGDGRDQSCDGSDRSGCQ
jgi:hypothetical protein